MENLLNYEYVKELIVYSVFGMIIGLDLWWIGYVITSGVKWVIKKIKGHKEKKIKEENPNE